MPRITKAGKPDRRGVKPFYASGAMRRECIIRTSVPDELRALLKYAAAHTGRSQAALVRKSLELHLPGLLAQPVTAPTTSKATVPTVAAPNYEGHESDARSST
jgi:hypothetical protein